MPKTATMTIRLDPMLKSEVEKIYSHYGMTLSEAVNVFFCQSLNVRGLPFDLRPSPETIAAMREVDDMKQHPEDYRGYRDVHQMFNEILNEEE